MLFVLIPIAWLTLMVLCVSVCRMAARGDALPAKDAEDRPVPRYRVRIPEPPSGPALKDVLRVRRGGQLTGHGAR